MEVIIASFLISLLVTVISIVIWNTYRTSGIQFTRGGLQVEARGTLEQISGQTRQAIQVMNSQDSYTAGASVLIIKLPSIDSSQNIIDNVYDYRVYRLVAATDQLEEITIADDSSSRDSGARPILKNTADFNLSYYNSAGTIIEPLPSPDPTDYTQAKQVRISLTASETSYDLESAVTFSNLATLRNYEE